eukprot:5670206-Amphidinium_carterae.2
MWKDAQAVRWQSTMQYITNTVILKLSCVDGTPRHLVGPISHDQQAESDYAASGCGARQMQLRPHLQQDKDAATQVVLQLMLASSGLFVPFHQDV